MTSINGVIYRSEAFCTNKFDGNYFRSWHSFMLLHTHTLVEPIYPPGEQKTPV